MKCSFFISSRMCFVVPFQIPSESTVPGKLWFPLKICFIFIHLILVIVNIGLGFILFFPVLLLFWSSLNMR